MLFEKRESPFWGRLLTVVRPQSAGHVPFVREARANDSFTFSELELSTQCRR